MKIKITEVYDLLYSLGLTPDNTLFFHTAYAVWLCVERQERLLLGTKWLYPAGAEPSQSRDGGMGEPAEPDGGNRGRGH